jgi:hypothetical protein
MNPEIKQVPVSSPTTDQLLEHHLVKSHEDAQQTHTLLEHHLVKGAEHDNNRSQEADNLLEATAKTHTTVEKGAGEIAKAVEDLKPALNPLIAFIQAMRGDPGEKGDDGEKGERGDTGPQGEKGNTGADSTIPGSKGDQGPQGTPGRDGRDGGDGLDGKDGIDGKDGRDGADGKDGSPDDADAIVKKISKRISYNDIKDAPQFPRLAGTGYLREISDVDTTGLVDGQTLKWSVAKQKWIMGTASGAVPLSYNISSQLNGSIKSFTIPANTAVTHILGSSAPFIFAPTTDFTGSGTTTITFTSNVDAPSALAAGQTLLVIYY